MNETDVLGVVREHRWMSADEQAELLRPECRMVVSLGGGTKIPQVDRERLIKMAFEGRAIRFVHVFLLADPSVRGVRQAKAAFRQALKLLVSKPGVVVEDMAGELTTAKPGQIRPMIAHAERMIGRSRQGARSAENGKRGNQLAEFDAASKAEAKLIWRGMIAHPTWEDCAAAYKLLDKKYRHKDPWTVWRSHAEWGKRRPARRTK